MLLNLTTGRGGHEAGIFCSNTSPQGINFVDSQCFQGTKKFRSDSPGLADFLFGLVEFILYLPNGQVKVFGEIFL